MKPGRLPPFLIIIPAFFAVLTSSKLSRHVKVEYSFNNKIFPTDWQKLPIGANAENIEPSEIIRSEKVTAAALRKYPSKVVRINLKSVYWLKRMEFYNVEYGGTNSTDALYLANDGESRGYSNLYLEQTFHHEFSSILLRNYYYLFDSVAWANANEPGFTYNDPEDGVGAIRNKSSSLLFDTSICRTGLLTEYSLSSQENDINTYAQNLFAPSPGFWELVKRYPAIRKKTKILIDFYHGINRSFTEKFFRKQS